MTFGLQICYLTKKDFTRTNKKQQRKNIITTKRHERGGYSHVGNAETIVSGDVVFEDGGVIRNAVVDELRQYLLGGGTVVVSGAVAVVVGAVIGSTVHAH